MDTPQVGDTLVLTPKTRRAEQVLLREGGQYLVVFASESVPIFNGPGIRIQSCLTGETRWVAFPEDEQFAFTSAEVAL